MKMTEADASLQHQIFQEAADCIVRKSSDDGCAHTKAAPQTAGDVVLAAALPGAKLARGGDPAISWIETQHDLAETYQVPFAAVFWSDRKCLVVGFGHKYLSWNRDGRVGR